MVFHVLLCETSDGLALVDTGLGLQEISDPSRWLGFAGHALGGLLRKRLLHEEQTALYQIEKLGYRAQDIRHIFPTHFDLDHVGGVSDFPHATVHVTAREAADFSDRRTIKRRIRYRPRQLAHDYLSRLYDGPSTSFLGVLDGYAAVGLEDEVVLIPTPGHTDGHAAIAVHQGAGRWLVHGGDSFFSERALNPAARNSGLLTLAALNCSRVVERAAALDPKQMLGTQDKIRQLRSSSHVTVFCAHDGLQFRALAEGRN